ncbi:hypothetical protein NDU88_000624 [Pleurodeles waltl]|uniref:Vegetative cell wall protein gp1-like n=1 Tax=Pleurodeles waltl TaxID=8319 RepID=A0AAV7UR17_PLEWA|nr:hypothetical protein NDU88_000624 [Pleurodeles waltl]
MERDKSTREGQERAQWHQLRDQCYTFCPRPHQPVQQRTPQAAPPPQPPPALQPALPPAPPPAQPPTQPPARLEPQRQSPASSPVGSRPSLKETSCCVTQQVLTHAPPPAPPPHTPLQAPPPDPRRARTVAPLLSWLPSPVVSRPRLEETSWTLGSFHEA